MEPLRITVHHRDDTVVLAIHGELDDTTAPQLRSVDVDELATSGADRLSIDLSGIEFMDSSGIGALVSLRNRATAVHLTVAVDAAPPHIRNTFRLAGLAELFGVRP